MGLLTIAYGLAGIGYIITATFLPVIARQALPGSHWLDLITFVTGRHVDMGDLRGAVRLLALLGAGEGDGVLADRG